MCRKSAVTRKTIALLLLCLMTSTLAAQQTEVVTVMSKALTNIPDKEGLMITVECIRRRAPVTCAAATRHITDGTPRNTHSILG